MKQRHSFTYLLYHLVFRTKHREAVFRNLADEQRLFGLFKEKAHQLDGRIEEFGSWYDHVHVLARIRPTLTLSDFYRQLKGYSSRAWNLKEVGNTLKWADGV